MIRTFSALMALLFLVGAAVQYNDPDAFRWIAIYLAASAASFLATIGRLRWPFPAAMALIALLWALTLAPRVFPSVRISEMFAAWEMANERVEEGREMYGLLIISLWMSVLAIAAWRTSNLRA